MANKIFYVWQQEDGLLCVNRVNTPKNQKFSPGVFVDISENLPSSRSHFTKGLPALVLYTHLQKFGRPDDYQNDNTYGEYVKQQGFDKDYSLLLRYSANEWCAASWYPEGELSRITDKDRIKQYSNELSQLEN